ncbi:hypothetical protein BCEP4_390069 [Burkholderia cepacia]|nr:hypothetical protein BCEP4_390069 [Burkholderia cepacia]
MAQAAAGGAILAAAKTLCHWFLKSRTSAWLDFGALIRGVQGRKRRAQVYQCRSSIHSDSKGGSRVANVWRYSASYGHPPLRSTSPTIRPVTNTIRDSFWQSRPRLRLIISGAELESYHFMAKDTVTSPREFRDGFV